MAHFITIVCVVIAAVALAETFLLGCQSWEHRRRARNRLYAQRPPQKNLRVALIAPCKGAELDLTENLRALFDQDYANYEIVFVTESASDFACATIESLLDVASHRKAKLVFSGFSEHGCQKVHSLKAAMAAVDSNVEVFAFVDSDVRPRPEWLGDLVQRLDQGVGVVTGYRWFVPRRFSAANAVLYSINATAASLYTPKSIQPIWGGSWAIRRDVFETTRLADQWDGQLTDDLVATNAVHGAGLRVEFEPRCMTLSPLSTDWRGMFAFLHRQYLIGRLYMTRWWLLALAAATVTVVGFWGSFAAALFGWVKSESWAWAPTAVCAAWYAINVVRAAIRRQLAAMYVPQAKLGAVSVFDALATPLSALINWTAIVSSIGVQRMVWRGVEYRIDSVGRSCVVHRRIEPVGKCAGQQCDVTKRLRTAGVMDTVLSHPDATPSAGARRLSRSIAA